MCGITGIVSKNSRDHVEKLDKMISTLNHRGPDGNGRAIFDNCLLGHNRLSIIDLSTGDQPMYSFDHKQVIVFNGEIYGYKDIKNQLNNYNFQTTSDTEVILALYNKYGEDMMSHLPGAFAFAIWDESEKRLFAARDRFGEKPFYYAWGKNNEFIFASEIKAIIASGLVETILDDESVVHYLQHLYVHPSRTIYKNIKVLPPAHSLILKDKTVEIKRYWNLPPVDEKINEEEAIEKFHILLEQAVSRQLVADVPVGVFLSGGLDSSTIVAVASKFKNPLKTFSFGFGDLINELPFASEIAKKYSTEHTELRSDYNIAETFLKMNEVYDEPFADSSNIPTFLISREASKYVKVALSGDAGDELFGGYDWYKTYLYNSKTNNFINPDVRFLFWKIMAKLKIHNDQTFFKARAESLLKGKNVFQAHKLQNTYFNNQEITRIGLNINNKEYQPSWNLYNNIDDAFRHDLTDYMPGDILVKTDRASLANGLELRAPFLDIDFASFCISLPARLKVNLNSDKHILRRAYESAWTESIRKRSKQGFGAPVKIWLKDKQMQELKNQYLNNPNNKIFNFISYDVSKKISAKNNYKTWALLVLALWFDKK
ncbi:MAG TPA: asparagine synthase (glutamine-hydrolyzing) [Candidatus Magasanikbacteria bacterium]|nr:asparagine synthase (glutamine-hydrolyzing) [Candidatus Magasanikbacteria bacterium]